MIYQYCWYYCLVSFIAGYLPKDTLRQKQTDTWHDIGSYFRGSAEKGHSSSNMVLGVAWLRKSGEILTNYEQIL